MVKPNRLVWFMLGGLVLAATFATAQNREGIRTEVTLHGTVSAIDYKARTVTLKSDNGVLSTTDIPVWATRFEQVKVGDKVTVSYYDRVIIRQKPAGEPAVDRTVNPTVTPAAGKDPGGTVAAQRVVTVTITGWDPKNRVVSFNGPNGAAYTRALLDTTDASIISGLKVGTRVDVTWTVATRFDVDPK